MGDFQKFKNLGTSIVLKNYYIEMFAYLLAVMYAMDSDREATQNKKPNSNTKEPFHLADNGSFFMLNPLYCYRYHHS